MKSLLNQRLKSLSNTSQRIIPHSSGNQYLELHKLDYEKRRIEKKLTNMDFEIEIMHERLDIINAEMTRMFEAIDMEGMKMKSAKKGTTARKLKY
ncbi:MAG: hypothetical protein RIC03_13575 [Cyclobacteriaceae bacterium]